MANNRMYIRCKVCGEKFMLLKYYPSDNLSWYSPLGMGINIDEWMMEHRHENYDMWGPIFYELEFEQVTEEGKKPGMFDKHSKEIEMGEVKYGTNRKDG